MKKVIRLTESDISRIVRRVIIEDIQGMGDHEDFSIEDLSRNNDFMELVSFFRENPDVADDIESSMDDTISEDYKYYDYSGDRGKKEITRNQYLKRKLINYGIWGTLGAIVGYTMGGMSNDDVLQAALMMAAGGGTLGAELSGTVGRERVGD